MTKMKKICKKFDKEVKPEVILNNFNTMLGHRVGRMLASVFHYDPNFEGCCCCCRCCGSGRRIYRVFVERISITAWMQESPRAHVREGHRRRVDAYLCGVIVVSLCCPHVH